jgi:hypothetical protein
MIPVEFYTNVYYFLLSITIVLSILPLFKYKEIEDFPKINSYVGTFLILVIILSFIGLRDPNGDWRYFGDTSHYTEMYKHLLDATYGVKSDIGFYLLMKFSKAMLSIKGFYMLCALIYTLPTYFAFHKWFKQYAFFALVLYVTSMSFWPFGINGIRNGLASSIFIFAMAFYERKWIMFAIMVLSVTFHKSMLLPFVAFLLSYKVANTKILIKAWLFFVVFSYLLGSQIENMIYEYFSNSGLFDDRRVETYFSDEIDGESVQRSYRLDFIIYSSIAILLGYYYKYIKGFKSVLYDKLLNTYILANIVWVILIYAAYTNRTAYLSWFIMPIVLIYPILKEKLFTNQNRLIGFMIICSLLFTLLIHSKTA